MTISRIISSEWRAIVSGVARYFTTPTTVQLYRPIPAPPILAPAIQGETMSDTPPAPAPSLIQQFETAAVTLWDKIKAWAKGEAATISVVLSADEKAILSLFQPLFAAAEASALQDLLTFIRGVLTTTPTQESLDAWETVVLNGLSKLGGDLETLAKSLGSQVLQGLIAFTLANLPKAG